MSIELTMDQLQSLVFDDEGNNRYPECYLMNGSQVLETVVLFSVDIRGKFCHGYLKPEKEIRSFWIVFDIYIENNKLFATSYGRM